MKKKQTHLAYGVIAAVVMIIVNLVMYLTGLMFVSQSTKYIPLVLVLGVLIFNAIAYSKANDGFVTFGNVYGSCFKACLISGVIMMVWGTISLYVFPEMKDKLIEMVRADMAKNPKMTDEVLDMTVETMKKYWWLGATIGQFVAMAFYGAILSLIAAAIPKKLGERPFTADNF